MADGIIIDPTKLDDNRPSLITPDKTIVAANAQGQIVANQISEEIDPMQLVENMKMQAMGFQVLFYLTCLEHKSSKYKFPKNRSKLSDNDYEDIMNTLKHLLDLDIPEIEKAYRRNTEGYMEIILNNIKTIRKNKINTSE